jgi:hypothetical protein
LMFCSFTDIYRLLLQIVFTTPSALFLLNCKRA